MKTLRALKQPHFSIAVQYTEEREIETGYYGHSFLKWNFFDASLEGKHPVSLCPTKGFLVHPYRAATQPQNCSRIIVPLIFPHAILSVLIRV